MKKEDLYDISVQSNSTDWSDIRKVSPNEGLPRGRKQRKSGFNPKVVWQLSMLIACVILGIMTSLLFKTYRSQVSGDPLYDQRRQLAETVKYLQTERIKLQTDLATARETINEFTDAREKGTDESTALRRQLTKMRQEAGWTDLYGPGIVVELNDSPVKPKGGDDPNFYIVHDIDLSALVNELWGSGAEAISINEQRLVASSTIRCVGPSINVNSVRLTPPYYVKAIGPPKTLETGLRYPGGFLDNMAPNIDRGVRVKISQQKDVVIPAFTGSSSHRFAQPVKDKGKEK